MTIKTTITIDVTKLPRDRIIERSYENKQGETVTVKEIRLEVVELDEDKHKVLGTYSNADLVKLGFVCLAQTKEERKVKAQTVYVGDATRFISFDENNHAPQQQAAPSQQNRAGVDDFDDPGSIPF